MNGSLLIIISVFACVVCPAVAVSTIVFSNYHINKKIHLIEVEFFQLYKNSEARIDRTNEMVCKLSDCISRSNEMHATITKEYATQIEKLQDARDAAVKQSISLLKQNSDLTKQNSILSSAATAPHINVNNNG